MLLVFVILTILFVYLQQIDSAIEMLEKGEAVDVSQLPPIPSVSGTSTGK